MRRRRAWRRTRRLRLLAPACLLAAACGGGASESSAGREKVYRPELPTVAVTLPDGAAVEAELAVTPDEQGRGLMFREYLPNDKGMLFVGSEPRQRGFWMYQCLIPLDIVWLDGNREIVEIERNVPPCKENDSRLCPSYGGSVDSVYVLELAAGQAAAHGLQPGGRIDFQESDEGRALRGRG